MNASLFTINTTKTNPVLQIYTQYNYSQLTSSIQAYYQLEYFYIINI